MNTERTLKSLTNEQFDHLEGLIDSAEWKFRDAYPVTTDRGFTPSTPVEVEQAEIDIIEYVDSLLAAKDAEIARLQARQIPPEDIAHRDDYGTCYFDTHEFNGWVASLGHGLIRRTDSAIHLYDAKEMRELASVLLGMIAISEERSK